MAKKHAIPEPDELNLTPIMNIVLVLIPLMLLSVVFMVITVIDVTMPQRSAGAAQNSGEPPKRLQVFVSKQGFTIVKTMESLPAIDGCPSDGPTICLADPEAELETDKHNWLALYNKLFEIKQDPEWASHDQVEIVADSAVTFAVLVRTMDVTRYQLVTKAEFDTATKGRILRDVAELNDSATVVAETQDANGNFAKTALGLFPVVILGLPTMTQ